jgi:uncharacterized protein YkwD
MRLLMAIAVLCCGFSQAALADITGQINALRTGGCNGGSTSLAKLRENPDLDQVAREWSKGGRLREALRRTGYRVVNSASMQIEGTRDDDKIVQALRANYCERLTDAEFTDIGLYRKGTDTWIVVALPFVTPTIRVTSAVASRVLVLVNEARSKPRRCGSKSHNAAPPLTLSAMLSRAALKHAQDMASHSHFEHVGTDGSTPAQRVGKVGYAWLAVAENIAAGARTADEVVQGWLNSPGHCSNLMNGTYTQMGIAYAVDAKSDAGIYWAQEFARPR